jgi:hypothetical protein
MFAVHRRYALALLSGNRGAPASPSCPKRCKRFVSWQIDGKSLPLKKAKSGVDELAVRYEKLIILAVFHPGAIRLFPRCDPPQSGRLEVS